MIVHPDFLDHWKTKAFIDLTGDPAAPLLILRLWAYCQLQRKSEFIESDLTRVIPSICRSTIPGAKLVEFLIASMFLRREGDKLIVHDWERHNRVLRSAWDNGAKAGYSRKGRVFPKNPPETPLDKNKKKMGYQSVTGGEPDGSQSVTGVIVKSDPEATASFGKALGDLTKQLRGSGSENL